MNVTEYEGSDVVRVECERCGHVRLLKDPSTRRLLALRCACHLPEAQFGITGQAAA